MCIFPLRFLFLVFFFCDLLAGPYVSFIFLSVQPIIDFVFLFLFYSFCAGNGWQVIHKEDKNVYCQPDNEILYLLSCICCIAQQHTRDKKIKARETQREIKAGHNNIEQRHSVAVIFLFVVAVTRWASSLLYCMCCPAINSRQGLQLIRRKDREKHRKTKRRKQELANDYRKDGQRLCCLLCCVVYCVVFLVVNELPMRYNSWLTQRDNRLPANNIQSITNGMASDYKHNKEQSNTKD